MTVIDLGDARGEVTDAARPRRTGRWRHRRAAALAALVAATLLVTGAAVPDRPVFRRLATLRIHAGDAMFVQGDLLYVAETRDLPYHLAAYDIRDGHRRWWTPFPLPVAGDGNPGASLSLSNGMLIAALQEVESPDAAVAGVDPATGTVRWRGGRFYGELPDGRSLLLGDPTGDTLSLLDAVTGVTRWTRPFGDCQADPTDQDQRTIVAQCHSGTLVQVLDLATGRTLASRDLAALIPAADPTSPDTYYSSTTVGDIVAVAVGVGPMASPRFVGLRRADLGIEWGPLTGPEQSALWNCDGQLCMQLGDAAITLDPHTGAEIGPLPSAPDQSPAPLDVLGGTDGARPPVLVLDPNQPTGIWPTSGPDTVVGLYDGMFEAPVFAGGFPTWVMRAVPDSRTALGRRFQVVDRLGGVLASGCFATKRYLACATALGEVTFYALPPGLRQP